MVGFLSVQRFLVDKQVLKTVESCYGALNLFEGKWECAWLYIQTHIYAHTHPYVYQHVRRPTNAYIHTYIHTYIHACTYAHLNEGLQQIRADTLHMLLTQLHLKFRQGNLYMFSANRNTRVCMYVCMYVCELYIYICMYVCI